MTIEKIWEDDREHEIVFLFKSMKSKHVEETMTKGRFCFSHPVVFNKKENLNSAQYDKWDSHAAVEALDIYVASIKEEKADGTILYQGGMKLADRGILHIQMDEVKHTPICCFRMIGKEDLEIINDDIYLVLGDDAKRIMEEFGHDAFIMMPATPFLERVRNAVSGCYTGAVIYEDTLNPSPKIIENHRQEVAYQLYRKDKRFAWQKEYRIALDPTEHSPVFVEIGSIEDIAKSGKLDDFLGEDNSDSLKTEVRD